jgi:hypothetical protein
MAKETAKIRIEIVFGGGLTSSVQQAIANGEHTSVKKIVEQLVGIYRKTLNSTPEFTKPLKELDKNVKILVEGEGC